ncbi:hypothetical protein WCD74_15650 [Actinomycetospora sp. OC33-EN08]|uniref:DUF4190 domain-containing protein n=1 Tax=Actinomycetospora aurantiaca TaxID=3129233 RepID=A0ABU8MPG4_9PSEU
MTTTSADPSSSVTRLAIGAGAILLMIVASVVGLLVGPEHRVDSGDLIVLSLQLGGAVLVWAVVLLLAREPDAGNRVAAGALVLGVLGTLGCVAFWVGVPLVLGVGAIVLGRLGITRAAHGAGRVVLARVGLASGVLAVVLWLAAFVFVQEW